MLATQLVATHRALMECLRQAAQPGQGHELRMRNLDQANKLARTFATLLEGLNRRRGGGGQQVRVEHVHIHQGGQAVVGINQTGTGGGGEK